MVQIFGGGLEQLVTRIGLQNLEQVPARVTVGGESAGGQNLVNLGVDDGNAQHRLVVGARCEQPQETLLASDFAFGIEYLDAHVVQMSRTVHRRARVGLGEDQQVPLAGLDSPFGTEAPEAAGMRLVIAQKAKAGTGDGTQDVLAVVSAEGVLAVAKKGEVIICQPQQKAPGLNDLLWINRRWRVSVLVSGDLQAVEPHLGPVFDRLTHVRKNALKPLGQRLLFSLTPLAIDLDMHPGLDAGPELGIAQRFRVVQRIYVQDLLQLTDSVATNNQLWVNDQMDDPILA